MGDAMKAAGVGPEIKVGDTLYRFAPFGPLEIAKLEAHLEWRARQSVLRCEPKMPPAYFQAALDGVTRDCAADVYGYGSDAFRAFQVSSKGIKRAVLVSLQAGNGNPPEIDEEFVERLFETHPKDVAAALVGMGWLTPKNEAQ